MKTFLPILMPLLLASLTPISAFAMGGDHTFSFYGNNAKNLMANFKSNGVPFTASTDTSICYTAANPFQTNPNGEITIIDNIKMKLQDQAGEAVQINSGICYYVGLSTLACEVSTATTEKCQ